MIGTPALWFAFAPALLWLIWRIVARRDPAALTVAVGIAAGWLTWFINLDRTMFIFYMAPAVPFFVLAVTLALQDVIGRARTATRSAGRWAWAPCASTSPWSPRPSSSSTRCSPAQPLTHSEWLLRMWFPSWF